MLALPPLSWDAFNCLIFEGSIDVSITVHDTPQICVFDFMTVKLKNKNGVLKLQK